MSERLARAADAGDADEQSPSGIETSTPFRVVDDARRRIFRARSPGWSVALRVEGTAIDVAAGER